MKKTKINYFIMLAILIASLSITQLNAQGKCEHRGNEGMQSEMGKGDKDMAFITDLTADQQKQISALKLNLVKERISIKNLMDEKKAHLKTISTGDNVDMVAVNKTIDEMYALKADMTKKHIAFQQDVRKLLTADQKVLFDIHAGKGKGRGEGMGKGCGMGMGQGGEMKGMGSGNCKMEGNGPGMGMGNGDMKGCKEMGNGNDGCKGNGGEGCCKKGEANMNGCQGHREGCKGNAQGCQGKGQSQDSPAGCCKKK